MTISLFHRSNGTHALEDTQRRENELEILVSRLMRGQIDYIAFSEAADMVNARIDLRRAGAKLSYR